MIADLFKPVPAAAAPAFCTKNISSVVGYLQPDERRVPAWCVRFDSPYDSLMIQRIQGTLRKQGEGGVGSDDSVESIIVDVERLRGSLGETEPWRKENLRLIQNNIC
jgi:hypothetical protein